MKDCNSIIDYLNSMNNAGANSVNALAESQVTSEYYAQIYIKSTIGEKIVEQLNEEKCAYIITGHAGDGKTSVLVQILKEMRLLADKEKLVEERQYSDLYYVKDMSEITKPNRKVELLKKTLTAPDRNSSAILVSNTGPLLKTFKALIQADKERSGLEYTDADEAEIENALLKQMDENADVHTKIGGYRFRLINAARIDNVSFARKMIDKLTNESLWQPCEECAKRKYCPFKRNIECLSKHKKRMTSFVEYFYRYLYENDSRLTIRQMMAHISYSITGNRSCKDVKANDEKALYKYNFANLFFGYIGERADLSAKQLKAVRLLNEQKPDKRSLREDYTLFVKRAWNEVLPSDVRELLKGASDMANDEARRAVRRFFLFYGKYESEDELRGLIDYIYGADFCAYVDSIMSGDEDYAEELSDLIFETLYRINCGTKPRNNDDLYLTLRRREDGFKNVMVITGKCDREVWTVELEEINSAYSEAKYQIVFKTDDDSMAISYPLIKYMHSITDGKIVSSNNPMLTHGIDKLNAMLYAQAGGARGRNDIRLWINARGEAKIKTLSIKSDGLRIR